MSAPANLSISSELPPRRRISAGYIFTMLLLSPVIIPVGLMLLLCGLSAIWGGILVVRRKYLDYSLDATMRSAGRYLTWQEFASRLNEGKGTLIVAKNQSISSDVPA